MNRPWNRLARARRLAGSTGLALLLASVTGCSPSRSNGPADSGLASVVPQSLAVTITQVDTRFTTRDHFITSLEMQLSGEPLAETMGRQLSGFSRDFLPPDMYFDPSMDGGARQDIPGFSTAVESYEYSKQPMNNLAFESGAGTSLAFAPLVSAGVTGQKALAALRQTVQHLGAASNATSRFVHATATDANPLGWPGIWPTLQPFVDFDPTIAPTNSVSENCSITSDDDPGASGVLVSDDYECDATSLHLPNRTSQVTMSIGPGATGWTSWKDALWVLNYLQVMHDAVETPVATVPEGVLATVGVPGNTIVGDGSGAVAPIAGTYLGSSDIEGFQAGMFLTIVDNQAEQWLTTLTTTDGKALSGFGSLNEALAYTTASPLRWFPGRVDVTESPDPSGFPRPSTYTLGVADSDLLDLAGMLGAFASAYSLTDTSNAQVGGSQPVRAYFDGDPFPADDQLPDGEPTLHDRALAMMRVLVVNMIRFHVDPTTGAFSDSATFDGTAPVRGSTLSIDHAAYGLLALRTARRALDSQLVLYSNTKPDAEGIPCPLDLLQSVDGMSFSARLDALIRSLSNQLYDRLTTDAGVAYATWDDSLGVPTDGGEQLDAHSAAIRGLLVAYLATGDVKFRQRAEAVWRRLDGAFYDPRARLYRTVAGDASSQVTYTARRFGILQAALRDTYELIAVAPGNGAMAQTLADRMGRLNKLVLNGWDDRDQDGEVGWPSECARVIDGLPRGGLQMGERTLSGETGSEKDGVPRVIATDREHDCVPEISAVGLPAALASSITFTLTPMSP